MVNEKKKLKKLRKRDLLFAGANAIVYFLDLILEDIGGSDENENKTD